MKSLLPTVAIALFVFTGAAVAAEQSATSVSLDMLSVEQLDALTNILKGLPRH